MLIERILSGVLLSLQLAALAWSVALCVKAHSMRRKIEKMIKLWKEEPPC